MKVRVAYKTTVIREIEVGEQYAECIRLADVPWGEFPTDRIDEWHDDCDKMHWEIAETLAQIDCDFDHVITITTENDNPIYEY